MCLSDAVPGPSPCGPQYGSIAMPLAIASREAACDDKRARNASNDAVTLTPTITLLRWTNHGDASSSVAVGSPPLHCEVAYQRKAEPEKSEAAEPVVIAAPLLRLFASSFAGAASWVLLQSKTCANRFSAHRDETSD